MIDRLMPIFAVIGVLSTIGYAGLAAWAAYESLLRKKEKRPFPGKTRQTAA